MKKVAYLLGNATMAELESKDRENRLHMDRIAEELQAVKYDLSSITLLCLISRMHYQKYYQNLT